MSKNFKKVKEEVKNEPIRLNRFIAQAGICSRREADKLIEEGLITVNGKNVTELGFKVNPHDEVLYKGNKLKPEKLVYILLNKPKDFLTTTEDPQERRTVMDLVKNATNERIYPVGRLDRSTTGILLLTNDGDLAKALTHPSHKVKKIYKAEIDKRISKDDFIKLAEGVELEEGFAAADDVAVLSDDGRSIGLEMHIGWNRVVRRMFEKLGYQVQNLDRVVFAGLDKKDLPRGKWRHLTPKEVIQLKYLKKGKK